MEFVSPSPDKPIPDATYLDAAELLDCDVAAIRAVAEVESARAPFQDDGRPTILYERHIFRGRTGKRFDNSHPHLSGPRGNYGKYSEQWGKLTEAIALDRAAALKSASFGQFQIMGFNHGVCGYGDVEEFVAAMVDSPERHLEAFISFVLENKLDGHLRRLDWAKFARGYNGPAFRENAYDKKMAAAYEKFASDPVIAATPQDAATTPDAFRVRSVLDLQKALKYLGMDPGPADNKMGPMTSGAIRKFQRFVKAEETGNFTLEVRAAAQAAYHLMRRFDAIVTV